MTTYWYLVHEIIDRAKEIPEAPLHTQYKENIIQYEYKEQTLSLTQCKITSFAN